MTTEMTAEMTTAQAATPSLSLGRSVWSAFGIILYFAIALFLPIVVHVLGIFSDRPETYARLSIPLLAIPFLMGYAQRIFGGSWRVMLRAPAVLMGVLFMLALIDSVVKHRPLAQDLVFWPLLIACYLAFSYFGKLTRDQIDQSALETSR